MGWDSPIVQCMSIWNGMGWDGIVSTIHVHYSGFNGMGWDGAFIGWITQSLLPIVLFGMSCPQHRLCCPSCPIVLYHLECDGMGLSTVSAVHPAPLYHFGCGGALSQFTWSLSSILDQSSYS